MILTGLGYKLDTNVEEERDVITDSRFLTCQTKWKVELFTEAWHIGRRPSWQRKIIRKN